MSCNIRTCPMAKLSNSYTWLHYILLLHSPCQIPFDVIFSFSIDLGEVFMILSSVASITLSISDNLLQHMVS